jgi:hypothetical protein
MPSTFSHNIQIPELGEMQIPQMASLISTKNKAKRRTMMRRKGPMKLKTNQTPIGAMAQKER